MEPGTVGAESRAGGAKWFQDRSVLAIGGEKVGDYQASGMTWLDGFRCRRCEPLLLHT
jgi:hypothetical protein